MVKLSAIVHRNRNTLWRQRLVHSLWYGCFAAALALLLLAIVHVLFAPVTMIVWLPFALIPPLLTALRVSLWQRPSLACAAADLDRQWACNDLLVTAWELLNTPPDDRTGGAEVVMVQAGALCLEIRPPRADNVMTPWRGPLGATPMTVLLVALFLLQLPTPTPDVRMEVSPAGPARSAAGLRPSKTTTSANISQPESGANPTADAGRDTTVGHTVAAGSWPDGAEPVSIDQTSGDDDPAAAGPAMAASGNPTVAAAPMQASASNDVAPASIPDKPSETLVAEKYRDIARNTGGSAKREIAGAGETDLVAQQQALPGAQLSNITVQAAQRAPIRYNNRFSLQQRLQINAYFDRLEELP